MTETVFGYHAVESVIRHETSRVRALHAQADRRDKRIIRYVSLHAIGAWRW